MFRLLHNIVKYLIRRRQNPAIRAKQNNNIPTNCVNIPEGYNTLEINRDEQPIPGLITQHICTDKRLLENPTGGIITVENKEGIQCGCNHFIYSIEPTNSQPGIGGQCPLCLTEAADLSTRGEISITQAEAMSLYCTLCSSRCDNCGRSICKKHTRQFTNSDATISKLCPDCLKQAEHNRILKQTLSILFFPFVDYSHLPSQNEKEQKND
jgi:hypothetical protein